MNAAPGPAVSAGEMVPPESATEARAAEPPPGPVQASAVTDRSRFAPASKVEPLDPAESHAPTHASEGAGSAALTIETELAGVLLQEPIRFEAALEASRARLPTGRQAFATAVGKLVAGDAAAALLAVDGGKVEGVASAEVEFLRRGGGNGLASASTASESALQNAGRMALQLTEAERLGAAGDARGALGNLSMVILAALDAPWRLDETAMRLWMQKLAQHAGVWRWRRDGDWPGLDVTVQKGDSLISIRKRLVSEHPQLVICTGLIARANQLNSETIHPGDRLRVPTETVSVLVDLGAHWAFFLMGDRVVAGWEVGVGRQGKETRAGSFRVGDKRKDPMWFPAGRDPVPFGDPRNPLGTRWIELEHEDGRASHLGFHGTNEPQSVGKDASEGCLRMRQADVEELFEILPVGALVRIQE